MSTQTECSSMPWSMKGSTKLQSLYLKVMWQVDPYLFIMCICQAWSQHNNLHLLQMSLTMLTRSSNQTHLNYVFHIWRIWRKKGTLASSLVTLLDSFIVISKYSQVCLWENIVKMRAMPWCWSSLRSWKCKFFFTFKLYFSILTLDRKPWKQQ